MISTSKLGSLGIVSTGLYCSEKQMISGWNEYIEECFKWEQKKEQELNKAHTTPLMIMVRLVNSIQKVNSPRLNTDRET